MSEEIYEVVFGDGTTEHFMVDFFGEEKDRDLFNEACICKFQEIAEQDGTTLVSIRKVDKIS